MKRKLILGLVLITTIFCGGSAYIAYTIESSTSRLNDMIMLHQVEILREKYLLQIKRVQSNLLRRETRHTRTFDTFVGDILNMRDLIHSCYDCHHAGKVIERIDALNILTDEYENSLSRVLTVRANASRLGQEMDRAFRIGDALIREVRDMVEVTNANLEEKRELTIQEISRVKNILYLMIGILPVMSLVFLYVVIREFANPMEKLLESTRQLKSGDLEHRVHGLKNEFGELAESINEMAVSLKEQMLKMQRTEQMVIVAELAAGLAHEIKNPLAGIKVAMHVLSEETDLPEEDRLVLRRVVEEVARLESLMRNFLNFAKPPKPVLTSLNVNELLKSTLTFYLRGKTFDEGTRDGIRIEKELHPLPAATVDATQLQHVLLNLILNAVDAMPEGGTLRILSCRDIHPERIRIEISDTGKGLSEEDTEKIFQPFYTTKPKGTGLGLAISRQMIERHGGTIQAVNNPDGGATFRVVLPVIPQGEEAES